MVKNTGDRRAIKANFETLRKNDYTVKEAYTEIARQAQGGSAGKKKLKERYASITPRIVRGIIDAAY